MAATENDEISMDWRDRRALAHKLLCHIGRLDLLGELPGYRIVIPAEVVAEITDESQREQVTEAIGRNILERIDIADPEELEAYAELVAFLGRGESACLAIAQNRGYAMASDDKKRKF